MPRCGDVLPGTKSLFEIMMNSLRYALIVLLASSLLVTAAAGTTAGRDRAATDSKYSSQQMQSPVTQLDQLTRSQLRKMSCSELRTTYQRGVQAVENSDLPPERKRSLVQRGTFVYNMYKFRKGC